MKSLTKIIAILFAAMYSLQSYSQKDSPVVISVDKMNVFYVGIDNPITIAAQGISNDKLKVVISHGTLINLGNGKYNVKPDTSSQVIINVAAELKPGEIKMIATDTFRVKKIPNPTACIGNNSNSGLYITKEDLLKNPEVNVLLNLPFDFKFEVVSYMFTYNANGDLIQDMATGNKFNQAMLNLIKKMVKGDKIYVENIKAKGPDGEIRPLSPIVINIIDKQ